jgi:hypothetical protein
LVGVTVPKTIYQMVVDNTNHRELHCHSGEGQNFLRQGLFYPVLYFIGTDSPALLRTFQELN